MKLHTVLEYDPETGEWAILTSASTDRTIRQTSETPAYRSIDLAPDLAQTIRDRLASGHYQSPAEVIIEALQRLEPSDILPNTKETILDRMGGVPQHLLHDGDLYDRDRRRARIEEYLQGRHQKRHS